jgi:hypothetical protein
VVSLSNHKRTYDTFSERRGEEERDRVANGKEESTIEHTEESGAFHLTNERSMHKFLLKIFRTHPSSPLFGKGKGRFSKGYIRKGVTEQWHREDRKNRKK